MTVPKGRVRIAGKALQKAIIDLAHRQGFLVAHFTAVKTEFGWRVPVAADGKGWPDLVLVRDRLIAAEIKGDGDSLSAEQKRWQAALGLAGVETYVWTPRSWLEGDVERVLTHRGT